MLHINSEAYQPNDAALLLRATEKVVRVVAKNDAAQVDCRKAARAVLDVVRTGYGRLGDHQINADDLAEAAITRYRAAG